MSKKFTDLSTKATASAGDYVPINDVSAASDKKTTVAGLAAAIAASFPANAVPAASLSTSQVGYAEVTADFGKTSAAIEDISGLSVSIAAPGGRRIRVIGYFRNASNTAGTANAYELSIREGSTTRNIARSNVEAGKDIGPVRVEYITTTAPSAGTVLTYKVSVQQDAAAGIIYRAGASYPAFISAEAI